MSRYAALRYLALDGVLTALKVIFSLLHFFQSTLNNVETACKARWDSEGGLCEAEEAKPDAGPEGSPRTTPSLEGTSWFGGEGHP